MMHLNILHRAEVGPLYEVFRWEQDLAHQLGLRTTVFLHYTELADPKIVAAARADAENFGDEIGLALHRLQGPGLGELAAGLDPIWLHSREKKRAILELVLGKYREVFGRHPASVAAYHFDASSLALLKELAPEVEAVVGGCFEEGVRVFHGCNHSWYLFNEGMPWGPWYPSKSHSLRPAADEADAAGVVAVPHLCRDMSLSYEGRNDFWASHPPNVIRGMGNEATWCPYDLNLVDQYRMQAKFNRGHTYYNTFVSASWLTWNHNSEYPPEVAQTLYRNQLQYFAELKARGELADLTMAEYARWFRANRAADANEVFWAKELLYGSGKHYVWFQDASQRVLVDSTQGGSIGDWRPYLGRYAAATGPDTPSRAMGSFPYLIQSQHRTGFPHHYRDGARSTLLLRHGEETIDLASCRTKCAGIERDGAATTVTLTPAKARFSDGLQVEIVTSMRFEPGGRILVERRLEAPGQPDAEIELCEYVKACYGFTEYPETMDGVRLVAEGATRAEIEFAHLGRTAEVADARCVQALLPPVGTTLALEPAQGTARGGIAEGHLFSPYFTLTLARPCRAGQTTQTWMKLNSIA